MLYSYTNGGNNVGYVPDKTTPIDSEIYKIRTVIGNAKNITVNMSDSTFVTKGELDRYVSITSGGYFKDVNKTNAGMSFIKGDNTSKIIEFITSNYNDSDTNKVLNLSTLKSLLGQGAIVASKLTYNGGYVKFANGFTIQWGIGGQDNVTKTEVTFPIRFTTLFMANAIDAYWSGSDTPRYFANSANESNNTKATFVASDRYAASYYWFALGMA